MKRFRFFLIIIFALGLIFPTQLFSGPVRPNVILKQNTSVLLSKIISSTTISGAAPVFYIGNLVLENGAEIYLNQSAELNAKKIILKPGSVIYTLGHDITIKTDDFISIPLDDAQFGSLSMTEKKSRMGLIHTRPRTPDGRPGDRGPNGGDGSQIVHYSGGGLERIPRPTPGGDGGPAAAGENGKSSGSVVLKVRNLYGIYVMATGGSGGTGGAGGSGGGGGNGFVDDSGASSWIIYDNWTKYLNGKPGGKGGSGGLGGQGGNGGTVVIQHETMMPGSDRAIFVENEGGGFGAGGEGGSPGASGAQGHISYADPQTSMATMRFGESVGAAATGDKGKPGQPGISGGEPKLREVTYEVQD